MEIEPLTASGESPLHRAARNGSKEVVSHLVEAGATVDIRNNSKWTPLHVATSEGHAHTVQYLLDHKADPKLRIESGWTALHLSSHYGRADVLKILLQRSPRLEDEIYSDGYRPLHKATEKGDVDVI